MRLQKVIVRAVFLDDQDREHPTEPVVVYRDEWDAYRAPGGGFDQATAQLTGPPPIGNRDELPAPSEPVSEP